MNYIWDERKTQSEPTGICGPEGVALILSSRCGARQWQIATDMLHPWCLATDAKSQATRLTRTFRIVSKEMACLS